MDTIKMNESGNQYLWAFLGGGLVMFLFYMAYSLVFFICVVTIPNGRQSFKMSLWLSFLLGKKWMRPLRPVIYPQSFISLQEASRLLWYTSYLPH